jgi:hypothetical protein
MDGDQWAHWVFGEAGPRLRRLIPCLVQAAHHDMAVAQDVSKVQAQFVYGVMWRRTLEEFARVIPDEIPGAAILRPRGAAYQIVTVNAVPLYPWRYAKDLAADPGRARLGTPPSGVRLALFTGDEVGVEQLTLDLGGDATDRATSRSGAAEGAPDDEQGGREAAGLFGELARQAPVVVVVQYASTPDALLRVRWGDGRLQPGGTVANDFAEDLDLAL